MKLILYLIIIITVITVIIFSLKSVPLYALDRSCSQWVSGCGGGPCAKDERLKLEWTCVNQDTCDCGAKSSANPLCISSPECSQLSPTLQPVSPSSTAVPTMITPIVSTPSSTLIPSGNCTQKARGDANCDGEIDRADYVIWKEQYGVWTPASPAVSNANFSCIEGNSQTYIVDMVDFEIWRRHTAGGLI